MVEHPYPQSPQKIAESIWWVGHKLEDDPFQCHAYLLVDGDQSVLFDPGSPLTFAHTRKAIEQVIPFDSIRYFVCHHQDPDITAALPEIDGLVRRDDAVIVTHGRAATLIRHYGLKLPIWLIEEHDWQLRLPHRTLDFIFTPYLHFPGAFCSHDRETGTLFTSDLFGGFTSGGGLFAEGVEYFQEIRQFHEHYMSSQDILAHGLARLETREINMIAPQHGRIIPRPLVRQFIRGLKNLQCGIYLLAEGDTRISHLVKMNETLREIVDDVVFNRDFDSIAGALCATLRNGLPLQSLSFFARDPDGGGDITVFAEWNRYRGVAVSRGSLDPAILEVLEDSRRARGGDGAQVVFDVVGREGEPSANVIIALRGEEDRVPVGVAQIAMKGLAYDKGQVRRIAAELSEALSAVMAREMLKRRLEVERQAFYEASIRDPLTGLYNRYYMRESARNLFARHDRGEALSIDVAIFDIDHFKRVNDTYGHDAGDRVLMALAELFTHALRGGDIPTRFGGEEFVVLLPVVGRTDGMSVAERIRKRVKAMRFEDDLADLRITISAGLARRARGETLDEVIMRADAALYRAKEGGRNRVVMADEAAAALAASD